MIYCKQAPIRFGSWATISEQPRESRMDTSESCEHKILLLRRIEVNLIEKYFNKIFNLCRLCTDLSTLIQERAEIEKAYAKSLKTWSKKWGELIEKGTW
jgi:hypothetical protein